MLEEDVDDFEKLFTTSDSDVEIMDVHADRNDVIRRLELDWEFFIEFFLHEQLDLPVPDFHKEIGSMMDDDQQERILLAIPRDHAKTTLSKLNVVKKFLFTRRRFCVYLSNTNTIAKGACKDIIEYFKHPNFIAVFGTIKILKESETESLWIFELTLPSGAVKRCILRAIGQGQQMRGINIDNQRPDLAVIDDVEDNENTESKLLQGKLDKWIFGPFLKALARRKQIIWLGNMLQKTSLLARLSRNPKWNPVVFGCLVKNPITGVLQPLWPGKWTVEALQEDFTEYRNLGLVETWMCEMMNMPGHGENGFTQEQINYQPMPTPDGIRAAWITIDPAFGKNAWNDESAVAVHVLTDDEAPITVTCAHGKWDERELFNEILSLAQYWNAWVWGIENIAGQRLFIPLFNIFLAEAQLTHVQILPIVTGQEAKISRIRAWVNLMANKEWAISDDDIDITTQILGYNFKLKDQEDDIIDASAFGPLVMDNYLSLILMQFAGQDLTTNQEIRFGMEVADV